MRKLLVFLGVAWIATNLLGAWVSVSNHRAYDLKFVDQAGTEGRIDDDWLHGWGTGLAMPLWVLAVAAVLTVLVSFGGGVGKVAAFLMMIVGGLSVAFTLSNQLTYDRLQATEVDRTETAIIIASLGLAVLIVLFGFLTVITTPSTSRR